MRASDKTQTLDYSQDDIQRARARSPQSRQLCNGSMTQLMEDAGASVQCPRCLRDFDVFDVQKNRDRRHPIIPSHIADSDGLLKVQTEEIRRKRSDTPRPY